MRRQIKYIDAGRTTLRINILESMRMLVRSWDAASANTVKNCFRKSGISEETQVPSTNDEDDPFNLLAENFNELKSRGLVYGDLTVDDYVNIDFETSAITDREILDSILINDYADEEEEIDEESNDVPPEKPKLSEIAHPIESLEC